MRLEVDEIARGDDEVGGIFVTSSKPSSSSRSPTNVPTWTSETWAMRSRRAHAPALDAIPPLRAHTHDAAHDAPAERARGRGEHGRPDDPLDGLRRVTIGGAAPGRLEGRSGSGSDGPSASTRAPRRARRNAPRRRIVSPPIGNSEMTPRRARSSPTATVMRIHRVSGSTRGPASAARSSESASGDPEHELAPLRADRRRQDRQHPAGRQEVRRPLISKKTRMRTTPA